MSYRSYRRSQRGFSLVELMISMVIGMLALVFATRLFASSEQTRQSSLGGSEAMQNGMHALFAINKDAAQAGWGLNDPLIAGCDTIFSDTQGYQLMSATRGGTAGFQPLAAALIESNGTAADRLTLNAGSSISGTGEIGLAKDYGGAATLQVDRKPFGFSSDDVIVVVPEAAGGPAKCALAQISGIPDPVDDVYFLSISPGNSYRFNRDAGLGANYKADVTRILNLGPSTSLALHQWSVENGFLRLRATNLSGAGANSQAVVGNIVSLKAQYGFDNRAGDAFTPELGMQIKVWSPTMTDADGDGVVGSAGDYQRIAALRIAVVARSKEPERPNANGSCSATTTAVKVFDTEMPNGVAKVPMPLNLSASGSTLSWQCYRYRVFESIVPMRNLAWRPTA